MSLPVSSSTDCQLFDPSLRARIIRAREQAMRALLDARGGNPHWTGELSASALSTATAITALKLVARSDPAAASRLREPIARGYAWLSAHQNPDGGWGDTIRSFSNISTTTLCWAAFGLANQHTPDRLPVVTAAERWLTRATGSLEPDALVAAIERRYGDDRTFSIPILTMCALCGRLGPGNVGWRRVRQLPFELAMLPQSWFGALRLPVVSYALPALIAIGQVRHGKLPSRNPLLRWLRDCSRNPTLEKLHASQPANGGFLEAAPLTSFVVMSIAALGRTDLAVVRRGVAFLEASQRPDGSWPIDTNLATWLTTLSVNALSGVAADTSLAFRTEQERNAIRDTLLRQQYRRVHPYTLAAPGGWAWTDLPGGVPDADDTAGALLALTHLDDKNSPTREAIGAGVTWLLGLQNRDGGIPTFCRGWGRLPFDRSSPDITAHAIRAWLAALPSLGENSRRAVNAALLRAVRFLLRTQHPNGTWTPLWFGHQEHPSDENPLYGTSRVVLALISAAGPKMEHTDNALDRALVWLVANQNSDGGWSGMTGTVSSLEETALALEALAVAFPQHHPRRASQADIDSALRRGAAWLADAIEHQRWNTPAPIGFYFAKLWYFERLYPLIFANAALTRLVRL